MWILTHTQKNDKNIFLRFKFVILHMRHNSRNALCQQLFVSYSMHFIRTIFIYNAHVVYFRLFLLSFSVFDLEFFYLTRVFSDRMNFIFCAKCHSNSDIHSMLLHALFYILQKFFPEIHSVRKKNWNPFVNETGIKENRWKKGSFHFTIQS